MRNRLNLIFIGTNLRCSSVYQLEMNKLLSEKALDFQGVIGNL